MGEDTGEAAFVNDLLTPRLSAPEAKADVNETLF